MKKWTDILVGIRNELADFGHELSRDDRAGMANAITMILRTLEEENETETEKNEPTFLPEEKNENNT